MSEHGAFRQIMDDIDGQLLTLLRHNGRRSISDLAGELGLSRATVRARIERMESAGRYRRLYGDPARRRHRPCRSAASC
jgi:DNA-binding Lrp family transcriptional regulator